MGVFWSVSLTPRAQILMFGSGSCPSARPRAWSLTVHCANALLKAAPFCHTVVSESKHQLVRFGHWEFCMLVEQSYNEWRCLGLSNKVANCIHRSLHCWPRAMSSERGRGLYETQTKSQNPFVNFSLLLLVSHPEPLAQVWTCPFEASPESFHPFSAFLQWLSAQGRGMARQNSFPLPPQQLMFGWLWEGAVLHSLEFIVFAKFSKF